MPLKGILKKKIDKFYEDYDNNNLSDDEKFQNFSIFHLMKFFEIDFEDTLNGIVDNGDDYGIDAIYSFIDGHIISNIEDIEQFFTNESRILVKIIQAKNQKGFKEDALLKLKDGLENIFEIDKPIKGNARLIYKGKIVREIWTKWHNSKNKKDFEVNIDYVTLGKSDDINHKVIDKKNKIIKFLDYMGLKSSKFSFIDQKTLFDLSSREKYSKVIEAMNFIEYDMDHNKDVRGYVIIVNGKNFYDFIVDTDENIEDKIFELNVRDYQESSIEVNRNIQNTLKESNRSNFWCMNNGITILSSSIKRKSNKFNLENYYIINGCQTSYSIWEVLRNIDDINNFEIVVKLIETEKDDVALEIIQATNSQIPIDYPSLKSQEPIHKAIEEFFKNDPDKIYYERRKKFYKRRGYPTTKIIDPKKLYQIVKSVYIKKPSPVRRSPTTEFKNDHDTVFKLGYEFKYYKFACLLYLRILSLITKYKRTYDLDDFELAVINNGSLHIARILFSLLIKSDSKINLSTKSTDLCKNYEQYVDVINNLDVNEKGSFMNSVIILEKAVTMFKKEEGDIPVSNILKTSEFDSKFLDKEVHKIIN